MPRLDSEQMFNIFFNVINKPKYYLLPTYNLKSINEIDFNIHLAGIKYIVFDKDDTLTLLKSNNVIPGLRGKFLKLTEKYNCVIVSNGKENPDKLEGVNILKTNKKKPYNFQ